MTSRTRIRKVSGRWPWRASVIAWLVVVGVVAAVRHHYTGIYGFSTANYGWLAFSLVGGAVLAWRLAGTPPTILAAVRPLLAGLIAFVVCAVAVMLMGLIFLPGRPLQGGGDTVGPLGGLLHPFGRALPVAELVVLIGYVAELTKPLWRRIRRGSSTTVPTRQSTSDVAGSMRGER
jgi:hypothetical protein